MNIITRGLGLNASLISLGLGISFEIIDQPDIIIPGLPGGYTKKRKFIKDIEHETSKYIKDLINTKVIDVPSHLKFIDVKVSINNLPLVKVDVKHIINEPIIVKVTI